MSADTGTSSQASLQGWKKPLGCTEASFSPRARRLSSVGGKEQGRWARWGGSVAWTSHEPFPTAGMGAMGLSSVPAKR